MGMASEWLLGLYLASGMNKQQVLLRESHACGNAAWSTQGEVMGLSSLCFLCDASRCRVPLA